MNNFSFEKIAYSDPWAQSYEHRISNIMRGAMSIAYFYEEPNNSTFRYRAYNMAQVVNEFGGGGLSSSYFFNCDYHHFDEISQSADVLVICRSRYSPIIAHLISKFKSKNKKVYFDVDDLIFDTDYTHLVMKTLDLNVYDEDELNIWFSMTSRLGKTLRLCDGAITTNDFLADKIKKFSGLPVAVIPNFLNKEQLEISRKVFENKKPWGDCRKNIGYFSGSPSHKLDFALVEEPILQLMSDRDDFDLIVVGYINSQSIKKYFPSRVKKIEFQDYVNLQQVIGLSNVNLMPLQYNEFTECKSELKYFDAAVVGSISIASPSYTYKKAICSGLNGYLSKSHEWYSVISDVLNSDIDINSNIISAARLHAVENYSYDVMYNEIVEAFKYLNNELQ